MVEAMSSPTAPLNWKVLQKKPVKRLLIVSTPLPVRRASATAARDMAMPCAVQMSAAPTPTAA